MRQLADTPGSNMPPALQQAIRSGDVAAVENILRRAEQHFCMHMQPDTKRR